MIRKLSQTTMSPFLFLGYNHVRKRNNENTKNPSDRIFFMHIRRESAYFVQDMSGGEIAVENHQICMVFSTCVAMSDFRN